MSFTIVEPTTAIRDWLRATAAVTDLVDEHPTGTAAIYAGGFPNPKTPPTPAVSVKRIGGPEDEPVSLGIYQFDCIAPTASDAAAIAQTLASLLVNAEQTSTSAGVIVCGSTVQSIVFLPYSTLPNIQRYVVTAEVVTKQDPS